MTHRSPAILAYAGPLLERYHVIFCDVWGVLHNGRQAHAEAGAALARFRAGGGTVVLVSNAPVPADGVERVLDRTGVRRDAWDAIVASGEIALAHIAERGYRCLHRVGPARRDSRLFQRLPGLPVALGEADAIVCTGLADEATDTVATYRPLVEQGVRLGLPFVCANPDLVVDVGDRRFLCAGSIAAEYERHGGAVFWAGKPHPAAFGTALRRATELRGAQPEPARILAIGDALRTDLTAAEGTLFAQAGAPPARGAMAQLRW
jgi:HAD superfamily hydrolase (TIGR01459 family)